LKTKPGSAKNIKDLWDDKDFKNIVKDNMVLDGTN